jgi:hypothetical protein
MTNPDKRISCYDVMAEVSAVTDEVLPGAPVFLVGGGPAAAIAHERTRFDHDGKRVIPTPDSAEPTVRDNGSLRDLDLLAFRVLEDGEGARAEEAILEAINGRMVVSVFGLDERREPALKDRVKYSILDWTSRRTLDAHGTHRYEIYPLEQVIPQPELVYEEWKMELPNGGEISVMSPDTTVANYDVRSISPRVKDRKKVNLMRSRVQAEPPFMERIDGPLKPVQELADAIVQLGYGFLDNDSPLLVSGATMFGRGAFRVRAKLYRLGEKSDTLVKFVGHNEGIQKRIKATTGRK